MEIQEKKPAVGVIALAGRRLRFEHRRSGIQILLPANRQGVRQVGSNEIALGVDRGVDPMVD